MITTQYCDALTVEAGVEQVFPEVAAKHALLHDTSTLELRPGRALGEECAQERDELATAPQN